MGAGLLFSIFTKTAKQPPHIPKQRYSGKVIGKTALEALLRPQFCKGKERTSRALGTLKLFQG
jgi:hypothetical protein